jgi:hypothetical protein
MPLIHSKSDAAVGKNIERQMAAGNLRAQAIAIAPDVQRRAGGGKPKPSHTKRMAELLRK